MNELYDIRVRSIYRYVMREDILFWLVNIYLFFEYVRPQTLYPVLDILPYAQILILITLFFMLVRKRTPYVGNPINKLLVLFFVIILMSSMSALDPRISYEALPDFIAWMLIYLLIINIIDTEERFLIFMLAFLLYNFKMAQHSFINWARIGFGYSFQGTGGGPGWFNNSGEFGIEMCIFFPLGIYFIYALKEQWSRLKTWFFLLFPVTAVGGMISSSSRGALVGGAAVMLWIMIKSRYKIRGIFTVLIVSLLIFQITPDQQIDRFQSAGEDQTSVSRIERWKEGLKMTEMFPVLGVGYKNWQFADRRLFGGNGLLCHNIFIESMAELGYLGLTAFLLMIFFTFINNRRTRKIIIDATGSRNHFVYWMAHGLDGALVGFLTSGFFVTVLYYPYFWINMAMTVALNNVARREFLYAEAAATDGNLSKAALAKEAAGA